MFKSNVPKYYWGVHTTWNILLRLSNWKQGSVMSGAVEGECIEFMSELPAGTHLRKFDA